MPLLDDRGRVFGKVNLIDAAVVLVILGLIPLGYASWGLFKTPLTKLETASPVQIKANDAGQRMVLTGVGLRPYLRVFVGPGAPTKYLFDTTTRAEIVLPALPAGSYDLTIYDETMELSKLPKVLTVLSTPPPVVTSVTPGVLEYTREPQHLTVKGERFPPTLKAMIGPVEVAYHAESGERVELIAPALPPGTFDLVLSDPVQELVRVPKAVTIPKPTITTIDPHVIDASSNGQRIEITGKHFQPTIRMYVGWKEVTPQFISLQQGEISMPAYPAGVYDLAIFDTSGGTELARYKNAITVKAPELVEVTLNVRFLMRPEVLAVIKQSQPARPPALSPTSGPVLVSYEQVGEELQGTTKAELKEGKIIVVNAVVRVLAGRKPDGLQFEAQPLKAGAPFILKAPTYQINGEVLGIDVSPARVK